MWITKINNENICLIDKNLIAQGGFSYYFKLKNKIGIKVITTFLKSKKEDYGISNEHKLEKSTIWKKALDEYKTQKLINDNYEGLSPKAYELIKVFNTINQKWYPAIVMEHIEGFLLEELMECTEFEKEIYKIEAYVQDEKIIRGSLSHPPENSQPVEKFLQQKFHHLNFEHTDLHWCNIIITPNFKIKVIDFGCVKRIKIK